MFSSWLQHGSDLMTKYHLLINRINRQGWLLPKAMEAREDARQVARPHYYPNARRQAPIEAVRALNVAVSGQQAAETKTFTDGRCSVCCNCSSNIKGKDIGTLKTGG